MRILLAHNYPQGFATGGEGHVFEDEIKILKSYGHTVFKLSCSNSEATDASLIGKLRAFWNASWSTEGYNRMAEAISKFKPDIVHVHNFFLIFSPSVFKAAKDLGVPVVTTLHNYRMLSPCSLLLRNDEVCEKCVGRNPWRILIFRCYKNSFWASLLRYRIYFLSRILRKWERYVDGFIVLTDFARHKLLQDGMSNQRIYVVPNCVEDPLKSESLSDPGKFALFIGRLTREKGAESLMEAWGKIDYPLIVVGAGDMGKGLEYTSSPQVRFVGVQPRWKVIDYLRNCAFLVMPSICYEGFGLVNIEAMAMGRAVAASGHGAMSSIVKDRVTGLHFRPGDVTDIREKVKMLINDNRLAWELGVNGRAKYLANYTPEKHYQALMRVYEETISRKHRV